MFDNIENLEIVSSLNKSPLSYSKITNRKTNSFIIRVKGSVTYNFYDKKLNAKEGEMVFLPKGISYEYTSFNDSNNENLYTGIHFSGNFVNPQPKVYSLENFFEYEYITKHYANLWKYGNQAEKYKCIALFYNLLSYVSNIEHSVYAEKRKFKIIDPAVNYLKKHLYDCNLKVNDLHSLCNISNTYFRQIFISRFGTTPQNYIISKRFSHAKSIIDSGDFDSVKDVALSVGYSDALYFSKVFKKIYGLSPSDINKFTL